MLRRAFGGTGIEVGVVGQGTWRLRDGAAAERALRLGLDLGMDHVDTAELYQRQSRSEDVVGRAIAGRRDGVFLASKVLPQNASYEGTKAACAASRKRLGAERLDLFYLHWSSDEFPIGETMRALVDLVDEGAIRFAGVSNFDVAEMEEARSALGKVRLAANQVLYHLGDRGIEAEILPWCRRHGVAVVGYSPFGSGNFPSPKSAGGKVLAAWAERLGRTPRQVALAFLARDPAVFLIPKAETESHVRENAGGDFALPKEAVEEIDRTFPMEPGLRFV